MPEFCMRSCSFRGTSSFLCGFGLGFFGLGIFGDFSFGLGVALLLLLLFGLLFFFPNVMH